MALPRRRVLHLRRLVARQVLLLLDAEHHDAVVAACLDFGRSRKNAQRTGGTGRFVTHRGLAEELGLHLRDHGTRGGPVRDRARRKRCRHGSLRCRRARAGTTPGRRRSPRASCRCNRVLRATRRARNRSDNRRSGGSPCRAPRWYRLRIAHQSNNASHSRGRRPGRPARAHSPRSGILESASILLGCLTSVCWCKQVREQR